MKKFLLLILSTTLPLIAERPYPIEHNVQEQNNVDFAITYMAKKNYGTLFLNRNVIRKKVEPLHPFAFLGYIFKDKSAYLMPTVMGRGRVKKQFLEELAISLQKEDKEYNLKPYIDDFAKVVDIDPNRIRAHILAYDTKKLIPELIDNSLKKRKSVDLLDL